MRHWRSLQQAKLEFPGLCVPAGKPWTSRFVETGFDRDELFAGAGRGGRAAGLGGKAGLDAAPHRPPGRDQPRRDPGAGRGAAARDSTWPTSTPICTAPWTMLEEAIRKMDPETKERFKQTFDKVDDDLPRPLPQAVRRRRGLPGTDRRQPAGRRRARHGAAAGQAQQHDPAALGR